MWNYNPQTEQTIYPATNIYSFNKYFEPHNNAVVDSINWPFLDNVDTNSLLAEDHFHSLKQISRMFVRATIIELPPKDRALKLFQILQIIITKLSSQLDKIKEQAKDIAKENKIYKEKIRSIENAPKPRPVQIVANKCPICEKSFKSIQDLDIHVFSKHKEVATLWQAIRTPQPPNAYSFPINRNIDSTMLPPQENENQEKLEGILNNFKERVTDGRKETERSLKDYIDRKMDRFERKFDDFQQDRQRQLAYQKREIKKLKSHKQNKYENLDHPFHGTYNMAYYNTLNSEQHQPISQTQPQQSNPSPETVKEKQSFHYVPPVVAESKKHKSTVIQPKKTEVTAYPDPVSDNPKILESDSNPFFIEPTPKTRISGSDAEYDSVPCIQTKAISPTAQTISDDESYSYTNQSHQQSTAANTQTANTNSTNINTNSTNANTNSTNVNSNSTNANTNSTNINTNSTIGDTNSQKVNNDDSNAYESYSVSKDKNRNNGKNENTPKETSQKNSNQSNKTNQEPNQLRISYSSTEQSSNEHDVFIMTDNPDVSNEQPQIVRYTLNNAKENTEKTNAKMNSDTMQDTKGFSVSYTNVNTTSKDDFQIDDIPLSKSMRSNRDGPKPENTATTNIFITDSGNSESNPQDEPNFDAFKVSTYPAPKPAVDPQMNKISMEPSMSDPDSDGFYNSQKKAPTNTNLLNQTEKEETNEFSESYGTVNLPSFNYSEDNKQSKKRQPLTKSYTPKSSSKKKKTAPGERKPSEKFLKETYRGNKMDQDELDDILNDLFSNEN